MLSLDFNSLHPESRGYEINYRKIPYSAIYLICTLTLLGLICAGLKSIHEAEALVQKQISLLPATWRGRKDAIGIKHVVAISLHENVKSQVRDFDILSSNFVSDRLEMFDATDSIDFDDRVLGLLSNAKKLEYLGLEYTSVTEKSLITFLHNWPKLHSIAISDGMLSESAVVSILKQKKILYLRLPKEFNNDAFRKKLVELSPWTFATAGGVPLNDPPTEAIPLTKWDSLE